MALNTDFKVKNSLYVSNSACFVGQTNTATILSAGASLFDIFLQEGEVSAQCALTSGTAINSINYNGTAAATIGLSAACNTAWNQAYNWVNTNGTGVINTVAEGTAQGQIAVTKVGGSPVQVDVKTLGRNDSPVFASLSSTGNILVGGTVDGVNIATRDAVLTSTTNTANDALPKVGGAVTGIISMGTCRITSLGAPVANQDAATKSYVDSVSAGLVDSVTAGNGTITIGGNSAEPTVRIADACVTALSGAFCTAASSIQGNIGLTRLNGGTCTLDIGLCSTDNVKFVDICATGNIAVNGTVDLRDIANDGTTSDTLRSLSGANIVSVTSPSQGTLNTTCAAGGTTCTINTQLRPADSPTFAGVTAGCITVGVSTDCTITTAAGNLTINSAGGTTIVKDNHIVTGDSTIYGNLSVTGDFTCLETTVSTTSALSVTNNGTGPALFVCQTGVQPIAHFIDKEGGDIVFNNDGYVGIGTFAPSERLTVSGNISANGTLTIDGVTTIGGNLTVQGNTQLGNAASDTFTINSGGICTPCLAAGTGTSVLVRATGGQNVVSHDVIDSKVFDQKLVDYNALDLNYIPKATDATGTIGNSCIIDTGSLVTIDSDTRINDGHDLVIAADEVAGATAFCSCTKKATFSTVVTSASSHALPTFTKANLKQAKYNVTLIKGVNITAFEVQAVYNNSTTCGTVYGIVDAQAATQLDTASICNGGSTIDLLLKSASGGTCAIVTGEALYAG